jgi:hypothetical protein
LYAIYALIQARGLVREGVAGRWPAPRFLRGPTLVGIQQSTWFVIETAFLSHGFLGLEFLGGRSRKIFELDLETRLGKTSGR